MLVSVFRAWRWHGQFWGYIYICSKISKGFPLSSHQNEVYCTDMSTLQATIDCILFIFPSMIIWVISVYSSTPHPPTHDPSTPPPPPHPHPHPISPPHSPESASTNPSDRLHPNATRPLLAHCPLPTGSARQTRSTLYPQPNPRTGESAPTAFPAVH